MQNMVDSSVTLYTTALIKRFTMVNNIKIIAILFNMLVNKITEFALQNQVQTIHVGR